MENKSTWKTMGKRQAENRKEKENTSKTNWKIHKRKKKGKKIQRKKIKK